MKDHAGVKASSPRLQKNASGKPPGSNSKKRKDSAVKKGFLETGKGGALYGDEGSREGAGRRRPGQWNDPEFERLVAMADPEMEPEVNLRRVVVLQVMGGPAFYRASNAWRSIKISCLEHAHAYGGDSKQISPAQRMLIDTKTLMR